MTLGEQPVPERRDAGKRPVPERCEMDELLKQKFDDAEAQGFGPAYAMFWELNGDTFELVADYVTDERRKVLRAKRGNNDTFCAMSRGIQLSKDGEGPVATAFRDQRSTSIRSAGDEVETGILSQLRNPLGIFNRGSADVGFVQQMKRAELAREFNIEAIRFEPTEDGVVEIGRAPQKWDELLRRKFNDAKDEGFGPAYAMFWELKGDTFELVADYVTDERRKVLRAKRGDDVTFCYASKGIQLSKEGGGPVATAFREQRPTMVQSAGVEVQNVDTGGTPWRKKKRSSTRAAAAEFGLEQMKRAELAREFDIDDIRFEPTEDGVVEIGRAPQTLDLPGAAGVRRVAYSTRTNIADTLLLVISGFIFTLETVPNLLSPEVDLALRLTEDTIIVIFALEFFARWYGNQLSLKFLTNPLSILDILSFAPFLALLSLKYFFGNSDADPFSNTIFETVGLLRVLRLQSFIENLESFENLADVVVPNIRVREWQLELARVGISLFTLVTVSAGIFYTCEHEVNPTMTNGFDALYFSIVTLTTVGFGDVNVITPAGKFALCCFVIGAAAVIPAQLARLGEALLADGSNDRFALTWAESEERFKQFDLNKDGYLDRNELEKLCVTAGLDRPPGNARQLAGKVFLQMDSDGDERLDLWEFDRKLPRFLQTKLMQSEELPAAGKENDEPTLSDAAAGVVVPTVTTPLAKLLALEEARYLLTDEEYTRARSKIVDSFSL